MVDGKLVMSRNPVQAFFHLWYVLIAETIFFFKTIIFVSFFFSFFHFWYVLIRRDRDHVDPPGGVKAIRTKADFDQLISSSGNTVSLTFLLIILYGQRLIWRSSSLRAALTL